MTLIRKIKVPAGSAVLCDFLVVPGVQLLSDTLLMPHKYHADRDSTVVCLIQASDKDVVPVAESAVGRTRAVEADLHVPVPFLPRTVCTLAEAAQPQKVPVHLQDLLDRSLEEQRSQLAELLTEFQDVFVRSEFDFWGISWRWCMILTPGPPTPVKEKMRRGGPRLFSRGGGG